ncbi:MAG: hypothetical protein QXP81_06280 [Nitrososphaerota archaeon]
MKFICPKCRSLIDHVGVYKTETVVYCGRLYPDGRMEMDEYIPEDYEEEYEYYCPDCDYETDDKEDFEVVGEGRA